MKGLFGLGKKKDESNQENAAQNNQINQSNQNPNPAPSVSGKYLIQYDRKACIGAGTCAAVAEKQWKMKDDGKAELVGGNLNSSSQMYERVIDEKELAAHKMAAEGCPPNAIHIINRETGEKII